MNIIADENMPLVEELFADLGTITRVNGRAISAEQLVDADVLLTRSVTKVTPQLLAKANKLRFVGTATIGVEHIDQAYLQQRNIAFSSAPACNAIAVAEYVISCLFCLAQQHQFSLQNKTVAIVGVGNIGQRLQHKLSALGIKLLLCDPPRAKADSNQPWAAFESVLNQADIISFHVPLITEGEHATEHLLNAATLKKLKKGAIVINASRGEVIDNHALLQHCQGLSQPQDLTLVLDVWESEPDILTALLPHLAIHTTHIAGHTLEGKARGTYMLYQALCRQLNRAVNKPLQDYLPTPAFSELQLSENWTQTELGSLLQLLYDVRRDHHIMAQHLSSQGFDQLRKTYPARREFSSLKLTGNNPNLPMLAQLGFSI